MAYFKFVKAAIEGTPIEVYNHGKMQRDFTYIDDIIEGIVRVMRHIPKSGATADTSAPYKLYNIGNNNPVELLDFIRAIEQGIGKSVEKILSPMQPGDVPITYADVDDLMADVGFKPSTSIEQGLAQFIDWYCRYYQPKTIVLKTRSAIALKGEKMTETVFP